MNIKQLVKQIKKECEKCKECDPSCTGNLIIKCVDNNRIVV